MTYERFQRIIVSIPWNFFTYDEMKEKFEEAGEGIYVKKESEFMYYLD